MSEFTNIRYIYSYFISIKKKLQCKDNYSNTIIFLPPNTYNLPSSAFAVWIISLVAVNIIPDLTSFALKIIVLLLSLFLSISLFLKNKSWRKPYNYILILLNAALIFINASGFNSITYSYANRLDHTEENVRQNSFLNLSNQVLWWPDYKLLRMYDSVQIENQNLQTANQDLRNQYASLEDWIKTKITDQSTEDSLNAFLKKLKATSSGNKPPQANAGVNQKILLPHQPPVMDAGTDTVIQLPANTSQKDSTRETGSQSHP